MMIQAIAILMGLVILSVPIAAVLGWLGLFMSNFHSFMPLHLAIGDIFWQNSIEFLLVANAATDIFFILMAIAFIDVIAGFSVSIRSAGRDVSIGL